MIGGNFWAHPDGSGFSQTGSDPNHTGFVNLPFDPLGNHIVYDYHPYSSNYLTTLTYTGGTSQTITARQISSEISVEILRSHRKPRNSGRNSKLILYLKLRYILQRRQRQQSNNQHNNSPRFKHMQLLLHRHISRNTNP